MNIRSRARRCFRLFAHPYSITRRYGRKIEMEVQENIVSKRVLDWGIINSINGHEHHEELMRGEGAKGDIGEETSNLG